MTLRPMVRRPSTRRRPVVPTVGSMVTSSPSGTTPPVGVATGTAASASGLSQPCARRIMSRRRSPSKCSPTQMPSPSERTTVATFARVQPDSLMRRSSGTRRSSGSDSSSCWNERTCAPGSFSPTTCSAWRAAESSPSKSADCSRTSMLRPSPKPPNRLPCCANTCRSGKPAVISSLTTLPSSSIFDGSSGRTPMVPPPGKIRM